jgi:hypothetical protein
MKIVLGGSRQIHSIPQELVHLIEPWVEAKSEFLVGDAPGADSAFQKALKKLQVQAVTVYSSAGYVRNNFDNWPSIHVDSALKSKSNSRHAFKDRAMTAEADLGLMLWDCESAGTLSNAIDMVESNKSCKIWVGPDSELYSFDNIESLNGWLNLYPEVGTEARKRLKIYRQRKRKRLKESQPELFD